MVLIVNNDSSKGKKELKLSKLRSKSMGLKKCTTLNENSDKSPKVTIFGPTISNSKCDRIKKSCIRTIEEKRHLVSKYTTIESLAKLATENIGTSTSRRILPNVTYRSSNLHLENTGDVKIGDTKYGNRIIPKKENQPKSQATGRKLIIVNGTVSKQKLRKMPTLPAKTKRAEAQTSCLIETFTRSCQTLRQSQMDFLNTKTMFHSLLNKIKTNKWGYEFIYVIFQTAAETSNMKSLKINKVKKPSMTIASVLKEIEHFDDLFTFDDLRLSKYETKELIEVLTWLLNDTKFYIKGTVNAAEVADIMICMGRIDFLPVAQFQVTFTPESHNLLEWSSIRNSADQVIQCFMFISPTKVYKYLRHGFSKKTSKQYVTFQKHLPFLEDETENFLIWDIFRTREEEELIMVAVVDMVDDAQYYEEAIFQDQIIYKVKDPAVLLIKNIILYSRNQYLSYKDNNKKVPSTLSSSKPFNISMDFTFWLALIFTFSLIVLCAYKLSRSKEENENKETAYSLMNLLVDALMQV